MRQGYLCLCSVSLISTVLADHLLLVVVRRPTVICVLLLLLLLHLCTILREHHKVLHSSIQLIHRLPQPENDRSIMSKPLISKFLLEH